MTVRTGLDRLGDGEFSLRGQRIGLLCHAASIDRRLRHAAERVAGLVGDGLTLLFGPEHGVRGDAQDMVGVADRLTPDPHLGVPVVSLYGSDEASLRPRAEHLSELDLLVVDLQDVGSRYYTYVWTMVMCLGACADAGVRVLVLDRPNPLGGALVEGPGVAPGFESFVGYHAVPTRHGLTMGEVAALCRAERDIAVDLEVLPMQGWRREMLADETGLPWVMPSPNMPTLDAALVYPGGCLYEGTNLSEGRGTTRPFELVGAPYVNGRALAAALDREGLDGVALRPCGFSPTFQKHAGQLCGGVQLHLTDASAFRPLRAGVAIVAAAHRLWPEAFAWRKEAYEFVDEHPAIDLLAGGTWLREGVEAGAGIDELCEGWAAYEEEFMRRREQYLLY